MLFEIGYEGINSTFKAFKDRNNISTSFTENYHSTTFGKIDRKNRQVHKDRDTLLTIERKSGKIRKSESRHQHRQTKSQATPVGLRSGPNYQIGNRPIGCLQRNQRQHGSHNNTDWIPTLERAVGKIKDTPNDQGK